MEMEIMLSVILLIMTFLTSLSTLLDLQKIEEMEKGDDTEICSSEKTMQGVINLTDDEVIEVPDEGPAEKTMDSVIDKPKDFASTIARIASMRKTISSRKYWKPASHAN